MASGAGGSGVDEAKLQDILWAELLRIVAVRGYDQRERSLYKALAEMRECGTEIVRLGSGKFGLRPVIDKTGQAAHKWGSQEQYEALRDKLLKPHHKELVECLMSLYCGALADMEQVTKVKAALADGGKGYVKMRSAVLDDEVVVIARDFYAAQAATVGRRARERGKVVYTLKELGMLVQCPPTPEELREIHQVKRLFNGTVMEG